MRNIYILFIFLTGFIQAQTTITGSAISYDGKILVRANVVLLDEKDHIDSYTFTNAQGQFILATESFGSFRLQVSYLNHENNISTIKIIERNKTVNLGTLQLDKPSQEIKEVVITRSSPIKLKKDTIEYNTNNFKNGTEQNVEDLLKKLPGITIEKDGKIKLGDKTVESVMIEGEDLFERGYQTLTQSMPSDPLDKVQVLTNYSKNKLLKNIENTGGVAINLTLKENAKSRWMGNAILASTSYLENMQQVKLNLMNFSKKRKTYLLFNYNNLGIDEMKGVEYLIRPSISNSVESVGQNVDLRNVVNLHMRNSAYGDNRTNFNNDKLGSLNYIYDFKNDWKIKLVTIFNQTQNRNYLDSYYRFNDGNTQFTNIENKSWKQSLQNIVGKLELSKSYKKASLLFYNKFSKMDENNDNRFLFNGIENFQNGRTEQWTNENSLVYTQKIDSLSAFVAAARYIYIKRPQLVNDQNNTFTSIVNDHSATRILQDIQSNLNFGGLKLSYLKSYNEFKKIQINLGGDYRSESLLSQLSLFDDAQNVINFDGSDYQNDQVFNQYNIFSRIKFENQYKKRWSYGFDLLGQYLSNQLNHEGESGFYLSPQVNFGYDYYRQGTFNLSFQRQFTSVGMNQLYINYIYQGNRNITKSNIGAEVLPSYQFNFSYSLGQQFGNQLRLNINYVKAEDYLSQNMIISQGYTNSQSILVKDNNNFMSNVELKRFFKFIKSRISLLGGYNNSDYKSSVNRQGLIRSRFQSYKVGLEMKSGWTKKINYELGYEWLFNSISSDINNSQYRNEVGYFTLNYNPTKRLKLEGNLDYFSYGNTNQPAILFLDFKANYIISKFKMNLYLHGNNLLNVKEIQRYSINNISESLYTQRLLPRHIVLGINKSF